MFIPLSLNSSTRTDNYLCNQLKKSWRLLEVMLLTSSFSLDANHPSRVWGKILPVLALAPSKLKGHLVAFGEGRSSNRTKWTKESVASPQLLESGIGKIESSDIKEMVQTSEWPLTTPVFPSQKLGHNVPYLPNMINWYCHWSEAIWLSDFDQCLCRSGKKQTSCRLNSEN